MLPAFGWYRFLEMFNGGQCCWMSLNVIEFRHNVWHNRISNRIDRIKMTSMTSMTSMFHVRSSFSPRSLLVRPGSRSPPRSLPGRPYWLDKLRRESKFESKSFDWISTKLSLWESQFDKFDMVFQLCNVSTESSKWRRATSNRHLQFSSMSVQFSYTWDMREENSMFYSMF